MSSFIFVVVEEEGEGDEHDDWGLEACSREGGEDDDEDDGDEEDSRWGIVGSFSVHVILYSGLLPCRLSSLYGIGE